MREQEAKQYLMQTYHISGWEQLTGGYTNQTYLLHGTDPLLVAKIASPSNTDIAVESRSLMLLEDMDLAPALYEWVQQETFQLVVMVYRKGEHGQAIVERKSSSSIERLYQDMGQGLAGDIHAKTYQQDTPKLAESSMQQPDVPPSFVPETLVVRAQQQMEFIQEHQQEWVLTHGDYGVHNVLYTDDNQLTVLDWEWAAWTHPLTDVSWMCWFTAFHYPEQASVWNQTFLQAYQKQRKILITKDLLQAYAVSNVWKILQKVQQAPRHVQLEWVKRLEWTLAHSFAYD